LRKAIYAILAANLLLAAPVLAVPQGHWIKLGPADVSPAGVMQGSNADETINDHDLTISPSVSAADSVDAETKLLADLITGRIAELERKVGGMQGAINRLYGAKDQDEKTLQALFVTLNARITELEHRERLHAKALGNLAVKLQKTRNQTADAVVKLRKK